MNPAYLMAFCGMALTEAELTDFSYITEESITQYLLNGEEVGVVDPEEINMALGALCQGGFIEMYYGDREGGHFRRAVPENIKRKMHELIKI